MKHKHNDEASIQMILSYQKENQLSNLRVANEFNLSRYTIAKWKKVSIFTNKKKHSWNINCAFFFISNSIITRM